ncbi:integral membrane protein [Aspergillus bombycis]|uniref:Integral membrane protein n=1 Tax=Aspergillus bombycis TaxID=109264 RepID=A0A1F7ZNX9_9EURO|nr:integral membrane protein [Aspergillus bombycis]OGM41142.1 integral membrane protein [Aspergillus bombycis]
MQDAQSYSYRDSLRPWSIVCQSTCLVASALVMAMRIYTKFFLRRSASWEDYTCLIASVGFIGYATIAFEADKVGSGIHEAEVAKEDLVKYAKLANASQIMYGPLIFITKLSILLLYLRVFAPAKKSWMYIFIHGLLWFNAAFYLADTLIEIFACVPREKIWNADVHGHCINVNMMILSTAILNTISDFSLLMLPIFCVWRLHMRNTQKLGLSAVFAAGLFACFSSAMRIGISVQKNNTSDRTYDWFPEFLWTSAEISAGIIASSLPAVPSFFRHVKGKVATAISSEVKSLSKSNRHSLSKRQMWSSNKGSGWKNGHGETIPQMEYNELDELHEWRCRGSRLVDNGIYAGRDATSIADSRTSQKGILKTVEIDVEETEIR